MVFIIEQGGYALRNFGDFMMLKVTVNRIVKHHPSAKIYIVSKNDKRLKELFPLAINLYPESLSFLYDKGSLFGSFSRKYDLISLFEEKLSEWFKRNFIQLVLVKRKLTKRRLTENQKSWVQAILEADYIIACGGGYLNDIWGKQTLRNHIDTLRLGQTINAKTAFIGQGLGPLNDKKILHQFKQVAHKLDLLTLRDNIESVATCKKVNINDYIFTGDDALALCKPERSSSPQHYIGVNIRLSHYTEGFDNSVVQNLATICHELFVSSLLTPRIVPISRVKQADDVFNSAKLIRNEDERKRAVKEAENITSEEVLLEHIQGCRLMITGCYHAGVLALGNGIPVIALVSSDYYNTKFTGLADCFKHFAIELIDVRAEHFEEKIITASHYLLSLDCKTRLMKITRKQVELAEQAYYSLLSTDN